MGASDQCAMSINATSCMVGLAFDANRTWAFVSFFNLAGSRRVGLAIGD